MSGINWTIEAGQHWALLGANGSGKTTLLKILCGYLWPTFGSVRVLGRQFGVCDVRQLRKLIGWVSSAMLQQLPGQDCAVEIVASGLEASIGLYRDFTSAEFDKAAQLLAHLGAGYIAGQRWDTLSQGEQQKTLIARALINEPKLLILDEPCLGLDPASRQRFLADLDAFAASPYSPTMVLVTHHIEEVRPWIQRVLLLKGGKVLAAGTPKTTLTSALISELFDCPCTVVKRHKRYDLNIELTDQPVDKMPAVEEV